MTAAGAVGAVQAWGVLVAVGLGIAGVVLLAKAVYFLVAWPYFLGSLLAAQFSAEADSVRRSAGGWICEAVIATCGVVALLRWNSRDRARRHVVHAAALEERRIQRESLHDQVTAFDDTLKALTSAPYDGEIADVDSSELVLATFPDVALVQCLPANAAGQPRVTSLDVGSVQVINTGLWFRGTQIVHWGFDDLLGIRRYDHALLLQVSTGGSDFGVRAPEPLRPALELAVTWAVSRAAGDPTSALRIRARGMRESMIAALPAHERVRYETAVRSIRVGG